MPLCIFEKGAKGRADIIVFGGNEENCLPLLVIECKAPEVVLIDRVFDQVCDYNRIILADMIAITNGSELRIWIWDEDQQGYKELLELPSYSDLLDKQNIVYDESPPFVWKRPDHRTISPTEIENEFIGNGFIGEGTSPKLYPFIINLAGLFLDDVIRMEPLHLYRVNIIADSGIRFTSFGNAAGGSWAGEYRFFILEDQAGNNQIISISILAGMKAEGDPRFGNPKGYTYLIVAVDDFDKSHNSLQLALDRFTDVHGEHYTIWHDGTMAVGNLGRVKKSDFLEYVAEWAPELMDKYAQRIYLGTFDNSVQITWNSPDTQLFIVRLIKYALIRDRYRQVVKGRGR